MKRGEILCSFLLFGVFFGVSTNLVTVLAQQGGLELRRGPAFPQSLLQLLQVLNEEIVFRALLLRAVIHLCGRRKIAVLLASILCALVFSVGHFLLYYFNEIPANQSVLQPLTLLNLFLFGLACSWAFIKSGSIAFPLALHAAWNIPRFGSFFYSNGSFVYDGPIFNVLEGTWDVTFLIAFGLDLVSIYHSSKTRILDSSFVPTNI